MASIPLQSPAAAAGLRPPPDLKSVLAPVAADMQAVDAIIRERLTSDIALVNSVAEYIVGAGGKRLRPAVVLLVARALGYRGTAHVLLAAVVEFIHTATLLHDDVVDESDLRRGRKTANAAFGNAASVLVGDFLYSRAFQMMVEADRMRVLRILADATNTIAEGEVLQLTSAHDLNLDQDTYLDIIRAKTAELFAAAAEAGAISAGASPEQRKAMRAYGTSLGLAFQLVDDALDYSGTSEALGKNPGDDFREGKATLPLLLAIQRSGARETAFWERTVSKLQQVDDDFRRARELVASTGAGEATLQLADSHAAQAQAELEGFASNSWRPALEDLADFAVARRM